MTTAVSTIGTTKIAISNAVPSTFDDDAMTGYPSLTFTVVGEVVNFPKYGGSDNSVPFLPIGQDNTEYLKGARTFPLVAVNVARDDDDGGQIICETAKDLKTEVSIEVQLASGAEDYFTGIVMDWNPVGGGNESIQMMTLAIQQTRDNYRVAA